MAPADRPVVLLVDDVPDHQLQYTSALESNGFRVEPVRNGQAALQAAGARRPDCVVIDERLDDMNGWELCRSLKAGTPGPGLPVILLTQEVSRAAAGKSVDAGCSAWMAHPSAADDLVRSVRYVLDTQQPSPKSPDEAMLGVHVCVACGAESVSAQLRIKTLQYYRCRACGFSWTIDTMPALRA